MYMAGALFVEGDVEVFALNVSTHPCGCCILQNGGKVCPWCFPLIQVVECLFEIIQHFKAAMRINAFERVLPPAVLVGLIAACKASVGWYDALDVYAVRFVRFPAVVVMDIIVLDILVVSVFC